MRDAGFFVCLFGWLVGWVFWGVFWEKYLIHALLFNRKIYFMCSNLGLAKWLSVSLRTKWLLVRVSLQSLKLWININYYKNSSLLPSICFLFRSDPFQKEGIKLNQLASKKHATSRWKNSDINKLQVNRELINVNKRIDISFQ